MDSKEIIDDILKGFHPKNHNFGKVRINSEKSQPRIYCTNRRNSESVITFKDVIKKKDDQKFIDLTPYTSICLIVCTLLFSHLSPLDQAPLCFAAHTTFLLMGLRNATFS